MLIDCQKATGQLRVEGVTVTLDGQSEAVTLDVVELVIIRAPPQNLVAVTARTADGQEFELI